MLNKNLLLHIFQEQIYNQRRNMLNLLQLYKTNIFRLQLKLYYQLFYNYCNEKFFISCNLNHLNIEIFNFFFFFLNNYS